MQTSCNHPSNPRAGEHGSSRLPHYVKHEAKRGSGQASSPEGLKFNPHSPDGQTDGRMYEGQETASTGWIFTCSAHGQRRAPRPTAPPVGVVLQGRMSPSVVACVAVALFVVVVRAVAVGADVAGLLVPWGTSTPPAPRSLAVDALNPGGDLRTSVHGRPSLLGQGLATGGGGTRPGPRGSTAQLLLRLSRGLAQNGGVGTAEPRDSDWVLPTRGRGTTRRLRVARRSWPTLD